MHATPRIGKSYAWVALLQTLGVATMVLAGCHHPPDPRTKICLPSDVLIGWDSIVFTYNTGHRLTALQYWGENAMREQYMVTYSGNTIAKCAHVIGSIETESYGFIYGQHGKPIIRTHIQAEVPAADSVIYAYDASDRLVRMDFKSNGTLARQTRYEYYPDNNVHKIYRRTGDADEILRFEYLLFDGRPRYFAGSPDLTQVEIYLLELEPSENNVTSFNLYPPPDSAYHLPILMDGYYRGYNQDTLIISFYDDFYINPALAGFRNVNYTCY